jgi:hypothetical protein
VNRRDFELSNESFWSVPFDLKAVVSAVVVVVVGVVAGVVAVVAVVVES